MEITGEFDITPPLRQISFEGMCEVTAALTSLATSGREERGAVFTKPEVVNFILDLVGYTEDRPLTRLRFLEPCFGDGDFILMAIRRLLKSWKREGVTPAADLADCVRAVELHRQSFESTNKKVIALLEEFAISAETARELARRWLTAGDYLLVQIGGSFDMVFGNPPYVRQEMIPDALMAEYRMRYRTIYDRADIYIPFIERSLSLLNQNGSLGFICADRWMKNKYGGPLRQLIAEQFHLKTYVDMVNTPAFHSDVIAYPGIVVISRERGATTRAAYRPSIDSHFLSGLAKALVGPGSPTEETGVRVLCNVTRGCEPWILDADAGVSLIRRLEASFPTVEEVGCKVGIGVATGADKAFIGPFENLDVEDSRKLPLAMTRDILTGTVKWKGNGVVNPFADDGSLVDLAKFPRLKRYLEARRDEIAGRHVAKKAPANWYRTIDRITPSLATTPKLLIPDIKGDAHVVFEDGRLYPHHNLYYFTSNEWDLKALQAVLMSGIARLFVSTYSTKMHGGFLRFQAQYLRRIRLPKWSDVSRAAQRSLIAAAERNDVHSCNEAVFQLYGLTESERAVLKANGI